MKIVKMRLEGVLQPLVLLLVQLLDKLHAQLLLDESVTCQSNQMRVAVEFTRPFSGVVYADKFFQSPECRWNGDGSRSLVVPVPLNTNPTRQPYCGVEIKDVSGEFVVTLILSPVKNLLVDGMEGLTVRCLYNVGDVTLTLPASANGAGLFISPQTQTGVVTGSGGSPFLLMTIRDGHGISGDSIQSARVGQRITLDVVMQDTTIYDFWVHDCYAHDGTNSPEASISIVDASGCVIRLARAVDPPVFETSPVPNGAKHVYVHMYGFQFTTSQLVYFECQVRPCLQTCNRPQCLGGRSNDAGPVTRDLSTKHNVPFHHPEASSNRIRRQNDVSLPPENYNLTAVIRIEPQQPDVLTPIARDDPGGSTSKAFRSSNHVCIDRPVAIVITVVFALVCLVSLAISIAMFWRSRTYDKQHASTYRTASPSDRHTLTTASPASILQPRRYFGGWSTMGRQ